MGEEGKKKKNEEVGRRLGQVIARGKGKWRVKVFLGKDAQGRRQYFDQTVRGTKKQAEAYLAEKLVEFGQGGLARPSDVTLGAYLDRWLEVAAKPKLAPRTFDSYEEELERYVREPLGGRKLSSIRPLDIQTLYANLLKKGLSARSVRGVHVVLNAALKQAVRWQLLRVNPAADMELPRQQKTEMKAMNLEEVLKFLEACREDPLGLVLVFALATGMRPEEYIGLQWKDIDWDNGTATVQRTVCWRRKGGGWYYGEPKTSRSNRTIPLPSFLLPQLMEHGEKQRDELAMLGLDQGASTHVFTSEVGGPLDSHNLGQRNFKSVLKRAGLPNLRLYDLRHTMATLLLIAGENPKVVSERLGHASITLTLDTYSHVLPTMQKAAAEKLERLMIGDGKKEK